MMRCKNIITAALAVLTCITATAQVTGWDDEPSSLISTLEPMEKKLAEEARKNSWQEQLREFSMQENRLQAEPADEDERYWYTLQGIQETYRTEHPIYFQNPDEDIVKWIRYYAYYKRSWTERTIRKYLNLQSNIERSFDRYGVPPEVGLLCMIESGCSRYAISPAGACGMWQIMEAAGRENGLVIDMITDERFDTARSTEAAARILSKAYDALGDWTLAMAAYNCGTERVSRAIRKNGSNEWNKIKRDLPKETQQYIPSIIAMHYAWCIYRRQYGD